MSVEVLSILLSNFLFSNTSTTSSVLQSSREQAHFPLVNCIVSYKDFQTPSQEHRWNQSAADWCLSTIWRYSKMLHNFFFFSFWKVQIIAIPCMCWGFVSINIKLCRDHRNQQEQRSGSFLKLNWKRLCVLKCFERCKWTPVVSSHIRWWNSQIRIHANMWVMHLMIIGWAEQKCWFVLDQRSVVNVLRPGFIS